MHYICYVCKAIYCPNESCREKKNCNARLRWPAVQFFFCEGCSQRMMASFENQFSRRIRIESR